MKIRIMALMLVLAVIFSALTITVSAAEQTGLASPASVAAGEEFTANISVPANDALMAGVQFTMVFDNTALELVSLEVPTLTAVENDKYTDVTTANKDGKVNVQYGGVAGENTINVSAGLTIKYNFKALKEGNTTLRLTNGFLYAYAEDGYSEIDYTPADMVTEVTVTVTKAPCTTHNWGEWEVTTAPTCEEAGEETRTCPDCSATETHEVAALGHKWVDADCETPKTCSVCGETEGDALGHKWVDADCETPKTCSVCGATEGDALGHTWVDADCETPKTCSVCGETEGDALGHTTGEWQYDDEDHWKVCSACGETVDKAGHEFDNDEDMICNVCPFDRSCKHESTTAHEAVASTCKTQGNSAYSTCDACGAVVEGSDELLPLDPTNHEEALVYTEATAAGCETEGNVEYWTCSACEKNFSDAEGTVVIENVVTEATGHDWSEWEDTTGAECGKPGVQTRICLNKCGETETQKTDALEHDWSEWKETTAPGCTVAGEETRTCERECGATETREVKALGHDWSEWLASYDGTCYDPGEEYRYCQREVCDDPETGFETRETAVLGHLWGEWVVTKEATCTEPGEKIRTCQRPVNLPCSTSVDGEVGIPVCGATETEEIPALGHAWGEWVETKAPTEDEEGEERRDCTRCEAYETRALEALGNSFMDEWYWTMIMLYNKSLEIEADASKGGEIDPEGVTKVTFARDMEYTITPDEGYEIEAVYVDGENIGAVDTYTFKRVTKDHTIYAVFAEVDETEAPVIEDSIYDDVDADDWFYEDVVYVTENGLMNGTGENKFSPEVNTTRAMIVTILWRLEGEADAESAGFTDVADDMWYTEAIDWAAANGIVLGYGDGTFGPEKNITREQVMAILHRYAAYKGWDNGVAVSMLAQYDCSVWAENDVNWADMCGILDNLGVDVIDMTAEADRAEIAAYFTRFCQNVAE